MLRCESSCLDTTGLQFRTQALLLTGLVLLFLSMHVSAAENGVLTLTPQYPQRGESVTITYRPVHAYGPQRPSFVATIGVAEQASWKTYRLALQPDVKSPKTYSTTFTIPSEARALSVSLTPTNTYARTEHIYAPVYKGLNPVEGALPELIWLASSMEEAVLHALVDEQLYPQKIDRMIPLIAAMVRYEYDRLLVRRTLDALWNDMETRKDLFLDEKREGYIACAMGYLYLNQLQHVEQALVKVSEGMEVPATRTCCLNVQRGFERISSMILGRMSTNPHDQRLIDILCSIAGRASGIDLQYIVLRSFTPVARRAFQEHYSTLLRQMAKRILLEDLPDEKFLEIPELYSMVSEGLMAIGEVEQPLWLLRKGILMYEYVPLFSSSNNPVHSATIFIGQRIRLRLLLGTALLAVRDTVQAIDALVGVFDTPPVMLVRKSLGEIATVLTNICLNRKDFMRAERYCAYALHVGHPQGNALLEDLVTACRSSARPIPTKLDLMTRYPKQELFAEHQSAAARLFNVQRTGWQSVP